jgi:serine/threonine protein kinase
MSLIIVLYSSRSKLWKIGDFGTTVEKSTPTSNTRSIRGTACYRAPELITEAPVYTHKVDIWSLGCILFELATCKKAFNCDLNVYNYANAKQTLEVSVPKWPKDFESHLSENVHELLAIDWERRPVASDARELFISYGLVLGPGTGKALIEHHLSLPSYPEWKRLAHHPDQLKLGCELAGAYQLSGDEEAAVKAWRDLVKERLSTPSLEIRMARVSTENPKRAFSAPIEETVKSPVIQPKRAYSAPVKQKYSFERWRSTAINEVREDLLSTKASNVVRHLPLCGHKRQSSRSSLQAAVLVPALLGTSVISAPSSPIEVLDRTFEPLPINQAPREIKKSEYQAASDRPRSKPLSI